MLHEGWCPAGRTAGDGSIPKRFSLKELGSSAKDDRTLRNVLDSDATVIALFGPSDGRSKLTQVFCDRYAQPLWGIDVEARDVVEVASAVQAFVACHDIEVLNVARPRAGKQPRVQDDVDAVAR